MASAANVDDKNSGIKYGNSSQSNEIRIITDEPLTSAPDLNKSGKTLSNIIVNSLPRFTVGIYGGWGTGKTSLMKMIQGYLDEKYKNDMVTIWFDAWRYENEEFSALVPLVRTIFFHLEEYIKEMEFEKNSKRYAIKNLAKSFKKVGEAILDNSKVDAEIGYSGAKASFETDVGKAKDQYKSGGYFFKNQGRIYYYEHVSDHVKDELKKVRDKVIENLRLVIFIDDLDRCTPERALEILESIKTFFDIEGIIFIIGIDPSTIDPIIKTKYGKDSKIDGMKYLQKIVQLPYTIPLWNPSRLSDTIPNMIKKTRLPDDVIKKVLDPSMHELILKATELNPRDVKRFINSIVISHEIYGHEIDDIDKMVIIQAFYFHGERWVDFLKLLIPYKQRTEFLMHFILWVKRESNTISNIYNLKNIILNDKYLEKNDNLYRSLSDKSLFDIYRKLVDMDDDELFSFLKASKEALLRIDKIERYLIVSDPSGMTNKVERLLDIDSRKQLNMLRERKVDQFNKYIEQGGRIHLPFQELPESDLRDFRLEDSLLFSSNLSGANLSGANLSGANLSGANLFEANLHSADLSKAKLHSADLSRADLSAANLYWADLSRADLSAANLSRADLSRADLSAVTLSAADLSNSKLHSTDLSTADLYWADLSGARLHNVNLSKVNLSNAKLSDAVIINCDCLEVMVDSYTDVSNAIITDPSFLKTLRAKGSQNVPGLVANKQQLEGELLKKNLNQNIINFYLRATQFP